MKPKYADILALTPDPPTWYDQHGTPRYCEFRPGIIGGCEVVLLKIECASCRKRFLVGMSCGATVPNYGDPPRHNYNGNRCAGEVMQCDDIRIMQFWRRNVDFEWERVPEYETRLDE